MDRRSLIPRWLAAFCVGGCALLAVGCASGGNLELMERELRLQEDRIYQLEDELTEQCKRCQKCEEKLKKCTDSEATNERDTSSSSARPVEESQPRAPRQAPPPAIPPIEVEVPGLPGTSSSSSGPHFQSPNLEAARPSPALTMSNAGGSSAPPLRFVEEAHPVSKPVAPDSRAAGSANGDNHAPAAPSGIPRPPASSGNANGWDTPPKGGLRILPSVSSYQTNLAPLNPPPGQVHVRLATKEPGTPLPLQSRPANTLPPTQTDSVPGVAPSPPPALAHDAAPAAPEKTWSPATSNLPGKDVSEERVARVSEERRDSSPDDSTSPSSSKRRPAWSPYR